jgi:L-alanine-DL-glutamate epimerase-like enolase superfamily enzyme
MRLTTAPIILKKRHPLQISRGLITENHNLLVIIDDGHQSGLGEVASGGGLHGVSPEEAAHEIGSFWSEIDPTTSGQGHISIHEIWERGFQALSAPTCAALDIALWDLHAKRVNMPLWGLLGLSRSLALTSVTIGINPPDIQRERIPEILRRTKATALKIKLGSPEGIDADKEAFIAIEESLPEPSAYQKRVDANGGWSLNDATVMIKWLSERGVQFVEQPLAIADNEALPSLFRLRRIPIFVDESCQTSLDVPPLASCVDGVVVKLMKSGGITEALRVVATARAHRLKTMIGCMGESSIGISAGASIGSLFDYIDLDSHLNLLPDPANGVGYEAGHLTLTDSAGHGAAMRDLNVVG